MSDLLGIWGYSNLAARRSVAPGCIEAMLRQLTSPVSGLTDFTSDALWLTARTGAIRAGHGQCAAYEGFVASPDWSVRSIGDALGGTSANSPDTAVMDSAGGGNWRLAPDGHFSLVWADPQSKELRLLRGLSGGERLYTLDTGRCLLFASSIRPLLAFLGDAREFNDVKTRNLILAGMDYGTTHGAVRGIEELRPGELLRMHCSEKRCQWFYGDLLASPTGSRDELARAYRERLTEAVCASAGSSRPVAVTLSGGIDSSAIAAVAVDAFGADQVHAFTYEFDDSGHPNETAYARAVCQKLGIRSHKIIPVGIESFLRAIPETVWRAESFTHWPKAFMLPVTRHLRDAGFERQLSGFGIGSHMAYFKDVAYLQRLLPKQALWLRTWALLRRLRLPVVAWLTKLHPGLEVPNVRLFELYRGLFAGGTGALPASAYQPGWMRDLVAGLPHEELCPEAQHGAAEFSHEPLAGQAAQLAFLNLVSCVDVTRWEKVTRELGCHRMSPAHFASCLPYAYLPYEPQLPLWHAERRARPGKHLLRIALRNELPESVLYRKKSWADAVISPSWLQAGARWMRQVVPDYPQKAVGADLVNATGLEPARLTHTLKRWDQRAPQMTVTALAFWKTLFLDRPPSARPPTWWDLSTAARPK